MGKSEKIDVGIITIDPEVELPAVLQAFNLSPRSKEHKLIDGSRYWITTIKSKRLNKNLTLVITAIGTPGNVASSTTTMSLIQHFNPALLLLVGIAAGIRGKVDLLDVVISESVLGYEPSRLTKKGPSPRPQSEHPHFQVLQDARFFIPLAEESGWLELFSKLQSRLIKNHLPPHLLSENPKVHMGTIASGEKLFADGSLENIRARYDEKIRAGEMEGIGFAIAADHANISWLIVRGISDFGDPSSKDGRYKDRYHFSAANAAASWTVSFLEHAYSAPSSKRESDITPHLINNRYSKQILDKVKNIIAIHGLDDDNWAKAISSQYFLVGIARLLHMTEQDDYKNLLNKFLMSFHQTIDNKIILEKNHILVTPEETEKIMECMKEEDKKDNYYSRSNKTRADKIDGWMLHYNYLYGSILKISSSKKYKVLYNIHQLAINELIYGNNGRSVDEYGGWNPYRIPWLTARILTSFKDSYFSEREDAKSINETINKALDSLIRRIYNDQYWRSGVGVWVSKWESTALCLEALDKWDYISKNKLKIKKVLNYIIENESDWMIDPPSFRSEELSNDTLASIVLICVTLQVINENFNSDEFSLDYDKYLGYLDKCVDIVNSTLNPQNRQFCTIPQIVYYIIDLLKISKE